MLSVLGLADAAGAQPPHHNAMMPEITQEQQAALQQIYADYEKQALPLQRQLRAKKAEIDALYYGGGDNSKVQSGNSKVQSLFREIGDIEAKLFEAKSEFHSRLDAKGLSSFARHDGMNAYGPCGGGRSGGYRGGGCGSW
jgi:hypothetical protein